jgi:hypothetical protein
MYALILLAVLSANENKIVVIVEDGCRFCNLQKVEARILKNLDYKVEITEDKTLKEGPEVPQIVVMVDGKVKTRFTGYTFWWVIARQAKECRKHAAVQP